MPLHRALWAAAGALLIACSSEPKQPKPPQFTEAFSYLPLPPNPEFVSRSGGAGALQLTFRTSSQLEAVAKYYRDLLSRGNWRLVSDMKNRDGSIALYAEHDGPPLWVRIWQAADQPGTMVQLTGAVPARDSSKARS
jgi:hypothetical protein